MPRERRLSHSSTRLGVLGQLGHDDLARDVRRIGVVAQQEALDELGLAARRAPCRARTRCRTARALRARRTRARRRRSPRAKKPIDVDVERPSELTTFWRCEIASHRLEPVAVARGALEVEVGGRLAHAPLELASSSSCLPVEEARRRARRCRRTPRGDTAPTHGPGPEPDVVVEARLARGRRRRCAVTRFHSAQVARQIGHDAAHDVDRLARRPRVRVRPEVARARACASRACT